MAAVLRRSILYSQNFLTSRRLVRRLLDRSSIGPDDLVLEIGPGRGMITRELAPRCRELWAIEKDPFLARSLRQRFADCANVRIREADFLAAPLPRERYKVFASIPFNRTAAILQRLTTPHGADREQGTGAAPDDAYLIVQREAAERCTGLPAESLYSVLLKPWFEPSILHCFRRTDFAPAPNVEAVMLRLHKRGPPLVAAAGAPAFRDFVTHGFTAWQPSLGAAFSGSFPRSRFLQIARDLDIDPDLRPSQIRFEQWLALFERLSSAGRIRASGRLTGAQHRRRRQRVPCTRERRMKE